MGEACRQAGRDRAQAGAALAHTHQCRIFCPGVSSLVVSLSALTPAPRSSCTSQQQHTRCVGAGAA